MIDHNWLGELRRHLDERHGHLCQRLDDLEGGLRVVCDQLTGRLEAHEAYHRANEHRWGLVRLAQRHPWRLATLMFLAGAGACTLAPERLAELGQLTRRLLELTMR